jgi:hypothetical protein
MVKTKHIFNGGFIAVYKFLSEEIAEVAVAISAELTCLT